MSSEMTRQWRRQLQDALARGDQAEAARLQRKLMEKLRKDVSVVMRDLLREATDDHLLDAAKVVFSGHGPTTQAEVDLLDELRERGLTREKQP